MAKQKKPVHRVEMTEGKRNIIRQLLEEYDIETAEDIQDALKDLLGGTIKEMMEAEKNLITTPGSERALTSLAVDEPLEYVKLYLDGNLQMWVDAEDSREPMKLFL